MPKLFLFIAILLAVLTAAIAFTNPASVPVKLIATQLDMPLTALVIASYLLGGVSAYCALLVRRREQKVEAKQLQWKTEDAKLQTEIQNDRVNQLELQVKTLESALDKALKKGKS